MENEKIKAPMGCVFCSHGHCHNPNYKCKYYEERLKWLEATKCGKTKTTRGYGDID